MQVTDANAAALLRAANYLLTYFPFGQFGSLQFAVLSS